MAGKHKKIPISANLHLQFLIIEPRILHVNVHTWSIYQFYRFKISHRFEFFEVADLRAREI